MNFPDHHYPAEIRLAPEKPQRGAVQPAEKPVVLTPLSAWRLLNRKTFGSISRATFYRWLSSGRIFSYRVGYHMYIPMPEVDNIMKLCQEGRWSRD
jgi:excisionase family DNA binding protein